MAVYRGNLPQDRFTSIANDWVRDPAMKLGQRGLLVYIASHSEGYKLTVAQMVAECADGKDAVYSALKGLRKLGYLETVTHRADNGTIAEVDYMLVDPHVSAAVEPDPVGIPATSGLSVSGLPVSGLSSSGQPAPKKNISKKTKPKKNTSDELALVAPIEQPETATTIHEPGQPETAQTILGDYIDWCTTNSQPVPTRVKGILAREIKQLIVDGFDVRTVKLAMAAWHAKGVHPSALSSFAQHANTPQAAPRTTQRVQAGLAVAQRFAEMEAAV